jgi:hypothetical protein
MIHVCLFIIGVVGQWCYAEATPVGHCVYSSSGVECVIAPDDLPIRASWYNPALCDVSPINCLAGTADYLGDGTPVDEGYGRYAACPPGMYGQVLVVDWAGVWECRDSGTAVVPRYGRVYTPSGFVYSWFLTVDFLVDAETHEEAPPWAYALLTWQLGGVE